jgi:hypothetical protein
VATSPGQPIAAFRFARLNGSSPSFARIGQGWWCRCCTARHRVLAHEAKVGAKDATEAGISPPDGSKAAFTATLGARWAGRDDLARNLRWGHLVVVVAVVFFVGAVSLSGPRTVSPG